MAAVVTPHPVLKQYRQQRITESLSIPAYSGITRRFYPRYIYDWNMNVTSMSAETTVLVVEDEEGLATQYADILSEQHEIKTAHDGEAALSALDPSIDVVLLDRRMPKLSGDEVLNRMPKDELNCRVVMVTAVDPDIDIVELSFDEYLVKPVSREELLDVVDRMIARNAHEEQLQELLAIAAKLATLETKLDIQQLEESEQYEHLRNRFEHLRHELEDFQTNEDFYIDAMSEKVRTLLNRTS